MFVSKKSRTKFVSVLIMAAVLCGYAADDARNHVDEALTSDQASGTETWSGAITGTSSITKTGGSTLILSNSGNDFSGGINLGAGNLQADAPNAFGTGGLSTVHGSYVYINTSGELPNAMTASSGHLQFKDLMTKEALRTEPTVFTGPIASPNSQILIDSDNLGATPIRWTFTNTFSAKSFIQVLFWGQARFEGAVTCGSAVYVGASGSVNSRQTAIELCSSENSVPLYEVHNGAIICGGDNVLDGAIIDLSWSYWEGMSRDCLDLAGSDQSVAAVRCSIDAGFTYPTKTGCRVFADDGKPSTLTITAGQAAAVPVRFMGPVSIVIDAPEGGQTFRTRENTMTGGIFVTNGLFAITGNASFKDVPEVVVAPNGRFVVDASAAEGALVGVTRLAVEGMFDASAATDPLRKDGELTLVLPEEGSDLVRLPVGTTLKVKEVIVGSEVRKGYLTHANLPQLAEGVTLVAMDTAPTFATWTGAGAGASMTLAGNWAGNATPNLMGGVLHMDFAPNATDNGTEMLYAAGTCIDSITNTLAQTVGASIVRKPMWIKPTEPEDEMILNGSIWNAKAAQLVLSGRISMVGVPAGTKANVAEKKIFCDLQAINRQNMPQGVIECALPDNTYHGEPLVLAGATVDAPIHIKKEAPIPGVIGYAGTESVVLGNVYEEGYHGVLGAQQGGTLELRGGFDCALSLYAMGPGTLKITDQPIVVAAGASMMGGAHLVLDASYCVFNGNSAREGLLLGVGGGSQASTSLEFLRNDCLQSSQQLSFAAEAADVAQQIELHCTTQQVGRLNLVNDNPATLVHGDYPSMFRILGAVRTGSTPGQRKALKCSVPVSGGVGFRFDAMLADDVFTLEGQDFASCGDLEVSKGTLELGTGASWLNGTNFVACGTGTMRFTARRQLNRAHARLHLSDDGKVEIPEGVTVHVLAADVNGAPVEEGSYTKNSTGLMSARVSGDGELIVGKRGLLLLFR